MHLPSLAGIYDSELPNFKVTSRIIIRFEQVELASFLQNALLCTVHKYIYSTENVEGLKYFMYRRPTLYPLEIAVDFLKSL